MDMITLAMAKKYTDEKCSGGTSGGLAIMEPEEDDIPKVFFGSELQKTKDEKITSFRYISKTKDIICYCKIKAQGNSTMGYPKKNQTVKLYKDAECTEKLKVEFKGWGKQNKFCFKANWTDITHSRNIVSARLWGDIVRQRSDYGAIPVELQTSPNQGAVDGFPVKVYANGVYQGRYTLNVPKDAWMANMDDSLDEHCILCGEDYTSGCFRSEAVIDGTDWSDEVHDTVPNKILTRWNEAISFVMNSTDDEFKQNISQYFDVTSLIDYHIFGLLSCGWDAFGKNQLYLTYDGLKWYATMYDMDYTWGLKYDGVGFFSANEKTRETYEDYRHSGGNLLYVRLANLFDSEIEARWGGLKSGALRIDNVINRFERFIDIAPYELVAEDCAESTANGAFVDIPSLNTNNIQQIRKFIIERYVYVDSVVLRNKLNNCTYMPAFINGNTGKIVNLVEQTVDQAEAIVFADYIPVNSGSTYEVTIDGLTDNTGRTPIVEIAFYFADKTYLGAGTKVRADVPGTFTVPDDVCFVHIGYSVAVKGGESANWTTASYSMYEVG
jgi:hypothetical protein